MLSATSLRSMRLRVRARVLRASPSGPRSRAGHDGRLEAARRHGMLGLRSRRVELREHLAFGDHRTSSNSTSVMRPSPSNSRSRAGARPRSRGIEHRGIARAFGVSTSTVFTSTGELTRRQANAAAKAATIAIPIHSRRVRHHARCGNAAGRSRSRAAAFEGLLVERHVLLWLFGFLPVGHTRSRWLEWPAAAIAGAGQPGPRGREPYHSALCMNPPLVDIGLNLAHDSFDHDRDHVVAVALAAGVRHM